MGQLILEREKIASINYWKKLRKDTSKIIPNLHGLVLLTHNSVRLSDKINFLNKIKENFPVKLLYISLINSYARIKETLEKYPMPSKKLFVIDCVSGFVSENKDTADCFYRKPPSNLEQLKNLLMKGIEETTPDIIVVDSLTQFINFSMPTDDELNECCQFLHSIKEEIWGLSNDVIILLYDDKMGSMKNLPVMNIDLILKLEIIREKPKWLS